MSEKQPLSTDPYKGVRDFYPDELSKRDAIFATIRTVLRLYGYEEYNASPLERSELYASKTSEEIVNEQTYTFEDRGGRSVTLRPEMTPTLARMVAAKRRELVFPLRWFSIGNRFRYERMQRGRLREFYQTDVDLVGLQGARAEGEIVVMAYEILKALGADDRDFTIRVNSRTLLNAACDAAGLTEEERVSYLGLLDRKNKMSAEDFEEKRSAYRGNAGDPLEILEAGTDSNVAAELEKLTALIHAFGAREMSNVVFDPTVVRGFLYYTGLVFEVFDTNPENPRALMGGGRYDALVALFGGDPIPAVGFAFGDVTLMDFLETHGILPEASAAPEVYIGTPSESDIPHAHVFAETLREAGIRTMVNITDRNMGDQVREADKRGIPFFMAIGEQEMRSNIIRIKNMRSGEEESLVQNEVLPHLTAALRK